MKYRISIEGKSYEVEIEDINARPVIAVVDGERFEVWPEDAASMGVLIASQSVPAEGDSTTTSQRPVMTAPASRPAGAATIPADTGKSVVAPIPGVIEAVTVNAGDDVEAGQAVCTLEAMKMKNIIRSNRAGTIAEIHVSVGQQVNHGDVLLTFVGG